MRSDRSVNHSYEGKCWQVMLEPLIVLTVVNCIFMLGSTVTTCALWRQYQNHRCCPRKITTRKKFDSKRSKTSTVQTAKKSRQSNFDGYANVVSKPGANGSREHKSKRCQKKRSEKDQEYRKRSEQKISFLDELETRKKFDEKTKMSEASQAENDTKSMIIIEFSTVQKVVQIADNDSDIHSARAPFKEIIIQKDTADKKHDYNVEQNSETAGP